jgi:hypothetical protein
LAAAVVSAKSTSALSGSTIKLTEHSFAAFVRVAIAAESLALSCAVVVAIVGVLSAVGLPALTKAQDKAKDSAAIATLTNAAKECSVNLIVDPDNAEVDFALTTAAAKDATKDDDDKDVAAVPAGKFEGVVGKCGAGQPLGLASDGSPDGGGFEILLTGSVPGVAIEADSVRLLAIKG